MAIWPGKVQLDRSFLCGMNKVKWEETRVFVWELADTELHSYTYEWKSGQENKCILETKKLKAMKSNREQLFQLL